MAGDEAAVAAVAVTTTDGGLENQDLKGKVPARPAGSGAAAASLLAGSSTPPPMSPTEEAERPSPSSPTPTAPRGAKSGRPHPKSEKAAFWRDFFQGLVEDKASLDKEKLDSCAAASEQLESLARGLLAEAAALGLPEEKVNRALCARLFPGVPLQEASADAAAAKANRRGPQHHRVSIIDLGDHPDEPSGADNNEAFVSTSKFAYVMERRGSNSSANPPATPAAAPASFPQAAAKPDNQGTRERVKQQRSTMPANALRKTKSGDLHQQQGPGLFICKHYEGGPEQIYDMDIQVGEGTFGTVRKAVHKQSSQVHVVKSIPKKLLPEAELWAEIDMMKHLDHPHIMRLYYTFEDAKHVHIASEMCAGGELFDAILAAQVLTESIAARLFKQCLSAVSYLHFNSICHRDLKPENFLLSRKGDLTQVKVKLIDFGTAKRYDLGPMTTKVCTVSYVAPEVLKRSCDPYTEKIDVWSCGVMLYVMLSGNSPWNSSDDKEVLKLVKKGKYAFKPESTWDRVSESAHALIRKMMCVKVCDRCTASMAMNDNWLHEQGTVSGDLDVQIDEEVLSQMRSFVGNNKLKKVALQVIARSICDDSIDKLRQIFMTFDKDMSGTLTMTEVEEAMHALSAPESVLLEMQRILCQMDMDGSGDINWTEFLASTMKTQQYMQEEVCRAAFHMMDTDGDGIISRADIVNLLTNEERKHEAGLLSVGCDQINQIMESVDGNGDGEVTFDEFMVMMREGRS